MAVIGMQAVTQSLKVLGSQRTLTALIATAGQLHRTCGLQLTLGGSILHQARSTVLREYLDRNGITVNALHPLLQEVANWFKGTAGKQVDWTLLVEDLVAIRESKVNLGRDLSQSVQLLQFLSEISVYEECGIRPTFSGQVLSSYNSTPARRAELLVGLRALVGQHRLTLGDLLQKIDNLDERGTFSLEQLIVV